MKLITKQIYNKSNSTETGFTLVETMVAVFILTIALTSLIGLTSRSLFMARYSRNEITANYLLQGAVDYIRNQRDSVAFQQKFSGGDWTKFLTNFGYPSNKCFSANGCYFNVNKSPNPIIKDCNSTPSFGKLKCPILFYDPNAIKNSFYNYTTGNSSNFNRKIFLKINSQNPDELYITITVEWLNGSLVRSRSLNSSLLNWLGK